MLDRSSGEFSALSALPRGERGKAGMAPGIDLYLETHYEDLVPSTEAELGSVSDSWASLSMRCRTTTSVGPDRSRGQQQGSVASARPGATRLDDPARRA